MRTPCRSLNFFSGFFCTFLKMPLIFEDHGFLFDKVHCMRINYLMQRCMTCIEHFETLSFWPWFFRSVDNAIHRIKCYPADRVVTFVNSYPLDSVIQPLNNREQAYFNNNNDDDYQHKRMQSLPESLQP